MRRLVAMVAALVAAAALAVGFAAPAGAYGGGASHDMWQIGFSFNCNNPALCGDIFDGTGGDWGWVEFDRSADGTQTWGDAEIAFCFHTVGGGGAAAGHGSIEVTNWTIAAGSAGPQTFFASGTETDSYRGTTETSTITNEDTGFSATPGHYSTTEILGFSAPGIAFQVQIAFRPAK